MDPNLPDELLNLLLDTSLWLGIQESERTAVQQAMAARARAVLDAANGAHYSHAAAKDEALRRTAESLYARVMKESGMPARDADVPKYVAGLLYTSASASVSERTLAKKTAEDVSEAIRLRGLGRTSVHIALAAMFGVRRALVNDEGLVSYNNALSLHRAVTSVFSNDDVARNVRRARVVALAARGTMGFDELWELTVGYESALLPWTAFPPGGNFSFRARDGSIRTQVLENDVLTTYAVKSVEYAAYQAGMWITNERTQTILEMQDGEWVIVQVYGNVVNGLVDPREIEKPEVVVKNGSWCFVKARDASFLELERVYQTIEDRWLLPEAGDTILMKTENGWEACTYVNGLVKRKTGIRRLLPLDVTQPYATLTFDGKWCFAVEKLSVLADAAFGAYKYYISQNEAYARAMNYALFFTGDTWEHARIRGDMRCVVAGELHRLESYYTEPNRPKKGSWVGIALRMQWPSEDNGQDVLLSTDARSFALMRLGDTQEAVVLSLLLPLILPTDQRRRTWKVFIKNARKNNEALATRNVSARPGFRRWENVIQEAVPGVAPLGFVSSYMQVASRDSYIFIFLAKGSVTPGWYACKKKNRALKMLDDNDFDLTKFPLSVSRYGRMGNGFSHGTWCVVRKREDANDTDDHSDGEDGDVPADVVRPDPYPRDVFVMERAMRLGSPVEERFTGVTYEEVVNAWWSEASMWDAVIAVAGLGGMEDQMERIFGSGPEAFVASARTIPLEMAGVETARGIAERELNIISRHFAAHGPASAAFAPSAEIVRALLFAPVRRCERIDLRVRDGSVLRNVRVWEFGFVVGVVHVNGKNVAVVYTEHDDYGAYEFNGFYNQTLPSTRKRTLYAYTEDQLGSSATDGEVVFDSAGTDDDKRRGFIIDTRVRADSTGVPDDYVHDAVRVPLKLYGFEDGDTFIARVFTRPCFFVKATLSDDKITFRYGERFWKTAPSWNQTQTFDVDESLWDIQFFILSPQYLSRNEWIEDEERRDLHNHIQIWRNCHRKGWLRTRFKDIPGPEVVKKAQLMAFAHAGVAASVVYQRKTVLRREMTDAASPNISRSYFAGIDGSDVAPWHSGPGSGVSFLGASRRLRATMWCNRSVIPAETDRIDEEEARTFHRTPAEREDDEDEEDAEDISVPRRLSVGPSWSSAAVASATARTGDWKAFRGTFKRCIWKGEDYEPDETNVVPSMPHIEGVTDIGAIVRSGILDRYQISTVYKYTGIRADIRAWAQASFAQQHIAAPRPRTVYNKRGPFWKVVASMENRTGDSHESVPFEFNKPDRANLATNLKQMCRDFVFGRDDTDIPRLYEPFMTDLAFRVAQLLGIDQTHACYALAPQYPVCNPWALYGDSSTKAECPQCKFVQFYIDCVFFAFPRSEDDDFRNKSRTAEGRLIVAEYKTLMEVNVHTVHAILNDSKTIKQVLMNALLLQQQTGLRVSHCVVLFFSRRTGQDSFAAGYAFDPNHAMMQELAAKIVLSPAARSTVVGHRVTANGGPMVTFDERHYAVFASMRAVPFSIRDCLPWLRLWQGDGHSRGDNILGSELKFDTSQILYDFGIGDSLPPLTRVVRKTPVQAPSSSEEDSDGATGYTGRMTRNRTSARRRRNPSPQREPPDRAGARGASSRSISSYIGRRVELEFPGAGYFLGTVAGKAPDPQFFALINWDDGTSNYREYTREALERMLLPEYYNLQTLPIDSKGTPRPRVAAAGGAGPSTSASADGAGPSTAATAGGAGPSRRTSRRSDTTAAAWKDDEFIIYCRDSDDDPPDEAADFQPNALPSSDEDEDTEPASSGGTEPAGSGPAGSGPSGSGPAGSGPAGSGPAASGSADDSDDGGAGLASDGYESDSSVVGPVRAGARYLESMPPSTDRYRGRVVGQNSLPIRRQICDSVWEKATEITDGVLGGDRRNLVLQNLNALFEHLRRKPRYPDLAFRNGVMVDPVLPDKFNVPRGATHNETYGPQMAQGPRWRQGGLDRQLCVIIARSVHRVLNRKVYARYVDAQTQNALHPIGPGSEISNRQLAERMYHVSNRAFWTEAAVDFVRRSIDEAAAEVNADVNNFP